MGRIFHPSLETRHISYSVFAPSCNLKLLRLLQPCIEYTFPYRPSVSIIIHFNFVEFLLGVLSELRATTWAENTFVFYEYTTIPTVLRPVCVPGPMLSFFPTMIRFALVFADVHSTKSSISFSRIFTTNPYFFKDPTEKLSILLLFF